MFGIGPMEMGIIAVVALLIFGPEKLPEMMGQAGKLVRDFRGMTAEMSGEFEKTIAEAKGLTKEFQGEVGSMKKQVNSVTKSVQNDLGGKKSTGAKKSTTASSRSTSKATSTASKKGSTSSSTSTKSKAAASKAGSTSKSTAAKDSSKTSSDSTSSSSTKSKVTTTPTASREDPTASVSLFEPAAPRRERRTRKATLASFGESTPRTLQAVETSGGVEERAEVAPASRVIDPNDPLVRARQRRQSAGYARRVP